MERVDKEYGKIKGLTKKLEIRRLQLILGIVCSCVPTVWILFSLQFVPFTISFKKLKTATGEEIPNS